jgi:hypothetical protein
VNFLAVEELPGDPQQVPQILAAPILLLKRIDGVNECLVPPDRMLRERVRVDVVIELGDSRCGQRSQMGRRADHVHVDQPCTAVCWRSFKVTPF